MEVRGQHSSWLVARSSASSARRLVGSDAVSYYQDGRDVSGCEKPVCCHLVMTMQFVTGFALRSCTAVSVPDIQGGACLESVANEP